MENDYDSEFARIIYEGLLLIIFFLSLNIYKFE